LGGELRMGDSHTAYYHGNEHHVRGRSVAESRMRSVIQNAEFRMQTSRKARTARIVLSMTRTSA
jgi:hypothetical protein